jgi:DNA-binding GntR family transcriptional regulator
MITAMTAAERVPAGLKRRTVTEAVADALRERILSGELGDGEQLRQDALATAYGVSRIPVREALRRLEAEGLVTFYPHRGAVVSQLSLDDILELFEIRAQLEPEILRRAVPRLARDDLRKARAILDHFASALERGEVAAWGGLNWEFHATLYRPAERPQTLAVIQGLHNNTDRYTRMQLLLAGAIEQAHQEHGALLSHCGRSEAKEAGRLLKRHITAAGRSLVAFLKDRRAGDAAGDTAGNTMGEPS